MVCPSQLILDQIKIVQGWGGAIMEHQPISQILHHVWEQKTFARLRRSSPCAVTIRRSLYSTRADTTTLAVKLGLP